MQETYQDLEYPKPPDLKELVKENNVVFSHYRAENFYYIIQPEGWEKRVPVGDRYTFPVPIDDIGNATMLAEDRAITYMRWIRAAIKDKTLQKI